MRRLCRWNWRSLTALVFRRSIRLTHATFLEIQETQPACFNMLRWYLVHAPAPTSFGLGIKGISVHTAAHDGQLAVLVVRVAGQIPAKPQDLVHFGQIRSKQHCGQFVGRHDAKLHLGKHKQKHTHHTEVCRLAPSPRPSHAAVTAHRNTPHRSRNMSVPIHIHTQCQASGPEVPQYSALNITALEAAVTPRPCRYMRSICAPAPATLSRHPPSKACPASTRWTPA